jgi:sec-independent protein translocase protein TatA
MLRCKCMFGLGVPELVVIANVIVLLFRPEQLPEVDRNIRDLSNSRQELLA